MAIQKAQAKPGLRSPLAAQFAMAVFTLWAGAAVAQSNGPITGAMGGTDARTVTVAQAATPVAQPAPVVTNSGQAQATQMTQGTQTADAQAQPARFVPTNVVRRTTPPRVGEHARDGMLGDETEALLAVQGNNLAAGPGLPMLGATTSRAMKRYLDSFTYPIPQFYAAMVQSDTNSGGGGGGGAAAPAAGAGASQ